MPRGARATTILAVDTAGRWLPEGVRVDRAEDGRVRLLGGEHDGYTFDTTAELREFAREAYPDLGPSAES